MLAAAVGHAAAAVAAVDSVETEVALRLDPQARQLAAEATLTVVGGGVATLALGDGFRVTRLSVDGVAQSPAAAIDLGEAGRHEVALAYQGVLAPVDSVQGRLGPQRAVAGAEGSFLPPGAGWPVLDGAQGDFWLAVTVPPEQLATATGRRIAEQSDAAGTTVVVEGGADQHPPAVFAGPYRRAERSQGSVRIAAYFHDEVAPLADDYLERAARLIAGYEVRIGRYPYAAFDIVSAPFPVGLGFAGAAYVSRRILPLPFMRGRSLAHEILHNWWGNGVEVMYGDGNWAEGLTTYMADYAVAEAEGTAREMRLGWLRDFAALPAARDMPVTAFTAREHGAAQVVGYGKVAMIFHMLRRELGTRRFDAALRSFWAAHRGREAGWRDVEAAFEAAAARDLGRFFDQWLTRPGAPHLRLGDIATTRPRGGDGWLVSASLSQSSPAYDLSVPVVVGTEAGRVQAEVPLAEGGAVARLRLASRPRWLAVDPDGHLFRRLASGEAPAILRDVMLDHEARLVLASDDAAIRRHAKALAARALEVDEVRVVARDEPPPAVALLVVGLTGDVDAFLVRAGLAVPAALRGRGSARAWAARRTGAGPLMVVAAEDAAALEAVLRPLPHYGGRSFVVFDGARSMDTGVWQAEAEHALRRRLGD